METLDFWLGRFSEVLWGPILIGLLVGTGIYLTLLLKGIQVGRLGRALKLVFKRSKGGKGDISPFQALTTALSATIGTGNIAGVATAITIGGVGAIFWMWVSGFIGMALKYGECLLSVRFRVENKKGEMSGGPMYFIERGLGWRWLGVLFALFGIMASLGIGNVVQVHSIADILDVSLGVPRIWTGVGVAVLIGVIVIGGIKSIGRVTSVLIPAMALFYVIGGLIVIAVKITEVPAAFGLIFESAFTGQAATGGFLGATAMMAMRIGVARGIFSNEAGLGSAGIAAAAARTHDPVRQGLISMTGPFFDTIIVCTITGLVLAVTGVLGSPLNGAPLTAYAFNTVLPGGSTVVGIGLILFAYSTILGWTYYGEKCLEYLFGTGASKPYRICFVIILMIGALLPLEVVWNFADIANGLMAFPNLIGIIALSMVIASETRRYFKRADHAPAGS